MLTGRWTSVPQNTRNGAVSRRGAPKRRRRQGKRLSGRQPESGDRVDGREIRSYRSFQAAKLWARLKRSPSSCSGGFGVGTRHWSTRIPRRDPGMCRGGACLVQIALCWEVPSTYGSENLQRLSVRMLFLPLRCHSGPCVLPSVHTAGASLCVP